jgi:hypothetical protein
MGKGILFVCLFFFVSASCDQIRHKQKTKSDRINRERCSFELPVDLYLGKIDSSFDEQGYFRILSDRSENMMQLFVHNSGIDPDEELKIKINALNTPDVFTARLIDSLNQFGNYKGRGVVMTGTYKGGIIKGKIKLFCYGGQGKGFIVVRQIINNDDSLAFKEAENSFILK